MKSAKFDMKKLSLCIALILSVFSLDAQKIPASLEHPATPELAISYGKHYKCMKASYYEFGAGLGAAAVGYGLVKRTEHQIELHPDPSGLNEAAGMVIVFEGLFSASGLLLSAGAIGQYLGSRLTLDRLTQKNDFLNTPGESMDSWKAYRNSCVYDASRKWMKVSGIVTCCLAGYTLAGVIACCYSDSGFLYYSTETAMWLGFASAATFLISWDINASSKYKLKARPALTYAPSENRPIAGLCLTANF